MPVAASRVTNAAETAIAATASIPLTQPAAGPALPVSNSAPQIRQLLSSLKKGDLAGANSVSASLRDPAARALGEWLTTRYASRQMGFARLADFLERYPDWESRRNVRRRAEEALYLENIHPNTVLGFFAKRPPTSGMGRLAVARALVARGDVKGAAAHARAVWREEDLPDSVQDGMLKEFGRMLAAEDYQYRAERLLYRGRNAEALKVAARAPAGYRALAQARAAVNARAKDAAAKLDAVPSAYRKDPGYLHALAEYRRREERYTDAAKAVLAAPSNPATVIDGREWWNERRVLARELLDVGEAKTAYRVAASHASTSPADAADAEFHAGWIALRFLNDPQTAHKHFAKLEQIGSTPITLSRARYWLGRAAEASGNVGGARSYYESAAQFATTYYGQTALAKLGRSDVTLRRAPKLSRAERAAFERRTGIRAVSILYAAGGRDEALGLFGDLVDSAHTTAEYTLLAELAEKHGDARAMTFIGKEATQSGHPLDDVAFPTLGIPKIRPAGPGVELPLVYAIARQESLFHPSAKSGAGAIGLMQMLPSTAKLTAKKFGITYAPGKLTDPSYNATLGATHLGELTDNYDGSYILTFVAYNAGPGRVRQWVEKYGDPRDPRIDPIDWVERIPFTETRNYVQRVMENVRVYRARLGTKASQSIEADLRGAR
ncbi:lytic transglycosylase domain-containing protein [Agaricicola taiwanensis]|nr:lytic transglycosylase domain-containing protein [Agaricicola taiwanensis]